MTTAFQISPTGISYNIHLTEDRGALPPTFAADSSSDCNYIFYATPGANVYEGGGGIDIVDYRLAGSTPITVDLSNTSAQNTGFGTATFKNIDGVTGSDGDCVFTNSSADNWFEGRGGNNTFNLIHGGHDTLLYKLLNAGSSTGGNGHGTVNGFKVGAFEATESAARIDLSELLIDYTPDADGPARYINGVATIDAGDRIADYLSVTHAGGNTILNIDMSGSGAAYTPLVTLNDVNVSLEMLLANNQIVV